MLLHCSSISLLCLTEHRKKEIEVVSKKADMKDWSVCHQQDASFMHLVAELFVGLNESLSLVLLILWKGETNDAFSLWLTTSGRPAIWTAGTSPEPMQKMMNMNQNGGTAHNTHKDHHCSWNSPAHPETRNVNDAAGTRNQFLDDYSNQLHSYPSGKYKYSWINQHNM